MKYLQAKATDEEILKNSENGGAVTAILLSLLEENKVDGVLNLKKGENVYDGIPAYSKTREELLETSGSLHCAPIMTSYLIAQYLKDEKIAVTTKACDLMAIDEIIKRKGMNRDNIFIIGLNCGGTVNPLTAEKMIELYYDVDPSRVVSEEISKGKFIIELDDDTTKEVKIDDLEDEGFGRRQNCQRCELKIPRKADIACGNWGSSKGYTFIEINTQRGEEIVQDAIDKGYIEVKDASEKQVAIRSKIENVMIKMAKKKQKIQLEKEYPTSDELHSYLTRCIKCYRCRDVCPICNCEVCSLEKDHLQQSDTEEPDPLLMHGIRMSHMAFSCINCGQCQDVCPMDIPLVKMYQKVQLRYRDETGYIAGFSDGKAPMFSGDKEEIVE